jgi:transposase
MGRLSTFAKNRILNLRFQKSYRIKQIAHTLLQEDNIKVSRKSISTFLKKYIETKSIHDKPRSGRNKKLTAEEINLIGEVTRLNRDITAPKIKEYLNLNVSTYTILRASKLFEWNKLNPNSNEAKKAAALERQLNGETKRRRSSKSKRSTTSSSGHGGSGGGGVDTVVKLSELTKATAVEIADESVKEDFSCEQQCKTTSSSTTTTSNNSNLNLITESEILLTKNVSSSPMVFATKILYKIFDMNELIGHNVSGKTFNKHIKNKKALDERRIMYIRWLIENNFETNNKEELWKSCRTAINKSIRNNELKASNPNASTGSSSSSNGEFGLLSLNELSSSSVLNDMPLKENHQENSLLHKTNNNTNNPSFSTVTTTLITLEPNMSIFQMSNDLTNLEYKLLDTQSNSKSAACITTRLPLNNDKSKLNHTTQLITLVDAPISPNSDGLIHDENKTYIDLSKASRQGTIIIA